MQGEITVKGQKFNNVMAPWASLSDAQIAAILTYERSAWGNTAAAVTAEQVAAVRAATSTRTTPWTPDEGVSTSCSRLSRRLLPATSAATTQEMHDA